MAEPPGSEGRLSKPPPLPRRHPTGGYAPGGRAREESSVHVDESTMRIAPPHDAALVEEISTVLTSESDSLAAGTAEGKAERLADLHLRLSLLAWDVGAELEGAVRQLELAGGHPLALRQGLAHALTLGSADALDRLERRADTADPAERAVLLRDIAEAWLYRMNDPRRALAAVRGIGSVPVAPALADELRGLTAAAQGAAGEWAELAVGLEADGSPGALAEAAALRYDRDGDANAAATLLAGMLGKNELGMAASALAIEVAAYAPDSPLENGPLLTRRLALLGEESGALRELQATRYLLATHHAEVGDVDLARTALTKLTSAGDGDASQWGARLAALTNLRILIVREQWDAVAALYRELGESGVGRQASLAYTRRAAQLTEARLADRTRALELWRLVNAQQPDAEAEAAVERLTDPGDPAALIAHLEGIARRDRRRAAVLLRRAALVAESRARDLSGAIRLRRAALASPAADDGASPAIRHDDMVRLLRVAGDLGRMADTYRDLAAAATGDDSKADRIASAYLWGAGVLEMTRAGREQKAEEALIAASRRAPRDPAARVALAVLYRRSGRSKELAGVLAEVAALCLSPVARFAALRELGELAASVLGDGARARAALEEALGLRPDDAEVMHALARLYDQARDWVKAIELRRRAAESITDRPRAAALWLELGQIEESQRSNDAAAQAAYARAGELDPRSVAALQAAARLHRKAGRHGPLLETLRREKALSAPGDRLLPLSLEIAQLAQQTGEPADQVIKAYREALALDKRSEPAMRGLESAAGAAGQWDVVAEVYRGAPETAANLRSLAGALARIEAWRELAVVQGKLIGALTGKLERAEMARAQAEVLEQKLGDIDGAIAAWQRALAIDPTDQASQRALVAHLEASGRSRDLEQALERELSTVPANDVERQVALLLRIGELRRTKNDRLAEAAAAYEAVLERRPRHAAALDALEEIFGDLGRDRDLLRIVEQRIDASDRPDERAAQGARVGALRERAGDIDGALDAYRRAFAATPDSRELFTALEGLCYRNERWAPVMDLYDAAIRRVEAGQSRAYRLGDLYFRCGQVLAQYLGEPSEAAIAFTRVVELEPDNDEAMAQLEAIFDQAHNWRALMAAHESRAQAARDPARKAASLRAAARTAAIRMADAGEAARLHIAVLNLAPSDPEAIAFLEKHYEQAAEWSKLSEILAARLAAAPSSESQVPLLLRIAQIAEEGLRDDDRAIEHYSRVLLAQPEHKQALDALARIFESTERWADFVDVTRRQIKVINDRNMKALLYFKCGSVMEAKFGKEDDAIRYYDAAIKTSPACLPAVHGLRDLYLRKKDWSRVIQTLELEVKLWQDDKERAGVFAQIGRIYGTELGEPARALHYYESALAADPDCVPANKALFEQFFAAADWDRALPIAQALAQKAMRDGDPDTRSEFFRKRGVVAWKTGDARSAAESIVISLEIKPSSVEALDTLAEVARTNPDAYDFTATFRELEKIYKKRDDAGPLMARVMVAQARMFERDGDLDTADRMYAEAAERSPADYAIVSAQVDLHVAMRRFTTAVEALHTFLEGVASPPPREIRIRAMLRLAEIHADYEMDAHKAIRVLNDIIRADAYVAEAYYLLAQEYYSLGRFADARGAVERLIELQAAPNQAGAMSAEKLARYYYYLGRIIEASGDGRSAASQYRRAAEYDPGYSPPALALAMRLLDANDQQAAETLLIDAAHAAMASGGEHAAVPLQRGLARILLVGQDRHAAIEAYRGILAVEPANSDDRLALAEVYAHDDMGRAIEEAKQVIERDLRHAPAYRLLASYFSRSGEVDRAARVLTAMDSLGYADDTDRRAAQKAIAEQSKAPLRQPLTDELRRRLLLAEYVSSPFGELVDAGAAEFASLFPEPPVGENLVPAAQLNDAGFRAAIADSVRLFGIEPDIYVGEKVPRGVVAIGYPRPVVVLDRELLTESDAARRFALGWAFETLVGRYSLLHMLGRRHRQELGGLLKSLFLPEAERPPVTHEFASRLPRAALRVMDRYQDMARGAEPEEWIDGMLACARRAGLFNCDDFGAALRVSARLNGENLGVGQEAIAALGVVICGADLVRFYLSDDYHRVRESLTRATP